MSSLPYALVALLAVAAGVTTWWIVPRIALRAAKRPVIVAIPAETHVLASVWADPRRLPYLVDLAPDDFAVGTHQRIWAAYLETARGLDVLPTAVRDDEHASAIGAALGALAADWRTGVSATLDPDARARLDALPTSGPDDSSLAGEEADESVVTAGGDVMGAAMDRTTLNGPALILPSSHPDSLDEADPPVERFPAHVGTTRRAVAATAATAWVATLHLLIPMTGYTGVSMWAATLSWLVLGGGMLIVALVDHDTMYIDMPAWAWGTGGAWAFAIVAAIAGDDPSRLIAGAVMVGVVAVLFEGMNLAYRLIRGRSGQGFGDTLIIIATVGIPPALTGQWALGYYSVMGALCAAVAGWCIARIAGKAGRNIPFAFGPWLALGPILAVLAQPLHLV